MTTAAPSTALVTIQPPFTDPERLALAGFLAGYRGLTREAYALDLRQFTTWCRARSLALFAVRNITSLSATASGTLDRLLCPDPVRHMSVIVRPVEHATGNCDDFCRRIERVVDTGLVKFLAGQHGINERNTGR